MASLINRVRKQYKKFATRCYNLLKEIISVSQDHVKWFVVLEFGLTVALKVPSSLFIAPFTVTSSKDGLRKLRIRGNGRSNSISWIFAIILGVRLVYYASNCLDPHFVWFNAGKFTADAVAFNIGLTLAGIAYLLHLTLLYYKEDLIFLYNSVIKLNKRISEKHLGTTDVMYMTSSKLIVVGCFWIGGICSCVPLTIALMATILRWSPTMLPYHVFGGKDKLMELEMSSSMAYWGVLLLDWGVLTGGTFAGYCTATICGEALISITLINRALRSPEARHLNWNTKRLYHVQLEISMNTIQHVMGKLIPLVVQGTSVLAGTSTIMVLHFDPFNIGRECGYCAFNFFLDVIVATWFGVFGILILVERVMEESEAVLKDIEEDILSQPFIYVGFNGGRRLVKTRFLARSFRRRILRLKVGDFRTVEPGLALEYFQMTAENIVTYTFMVDPAGGMWLF